MALSHVASEIFSVQKYRDLEIPDKSQSKSLKVVPFERLVDSVFQWRRSQICRKIWGGQGHSGQAIKLKADRNSFSAPKMGYLVIFGFFRFRPKMNCLLCFIFRFRSKMLFALGRKCYVRNWTVTKFCDIGTGDLFSAENGISFSSAFSFTAENEKCIFGRPLHQTVSDYTLRQWFSNTEQIPVPDSL